MLDDDDSDSNNHNDDDDDHDDDDDDDKDNDDDKLKVEILFHPLTSSTTINASSGISFSLPGSFSLNRSVSTSTRRIDAPAT